MSEEARGDSLQLLSPFVLCIKSLSPLVSKLSALLAVPSLVHTNLPNFLAARRAAAGRGPSSHPPERHRRSGALTRRRGWPDPFSAASSLIG